MASLDPDVSVRTVRILVERTVYVEGSIDDDFPTGPPACRRLACHHGREDRMSDYIALTDLAGALKARTGRTLAYQTLYLHSRNGKFTTHRVGRCLMVAAADLPEIARTLRLEGEPEGSSAARS